MPDDRDDDFELFHALELKYQTLIVDFKEDDALLAGEFAKSIIPSDTQDDGLTPIVFSTAVDAVDNVSEHILTTPRIKVPVRPVERGIEKQRSIADNKRQFLDMCWDRFFEEQGDPLGHGKKSLVKGKLVLKKEIDWSIIPNLPDNPTKKQKDRFRAKLEKIGRSKFLWKLRVVPKAIVFEDLDSPYNPSIVYEAFDITVMEALKRWPYLESDLKDREPLSEVEYVEMWTKPRGADRGKFKQWIGGLEVHSAINPYSWETPTSTADDLDYDGYVPYVIGDPGWGDVGADNNPFDRYVSLLRPMRSVVIAECRQATAADAAMRYNVWPILLTTGMGDVSEGERTLEVMPGAIWEIPEDGKAEFVPARELGVSTFQWLQKVQTQADRHSRFGAMSGAGQRGVDTATEADQNLRQAITKLSGPVNTLRRMIMQINTQIQQDIEKVLEAPITLYGGTELSPAEVTLNPRDIRGYYKTNVELATSDEAALNLRNLRTWVDAAQSAPISWKTALSQGGVENAGQEMIERQIEDIERSEPISQLLLSYILAVAAEGSQEATAVLQAFQQNMFAGKQGEDGQSPNMPTESTNPVEALRQNARNEAIQNQPERTMQ